MKASVVLYQPDAPSALNLRSFEDFARTILFGLKSIGADAELLVNNVRYDTDFNFIFGANIMSVENLKLFRGRNFYVNIEPMTLLENFPHERLPDQHKYFLDSFTILDYSKFNIQFWDLHPHRYPIIWFPPSYGENLDLEKRDEDIDVMFFGSIMHRTEFFKACLGQNVFRPKTVLIQNDYDGLRNELIMRSKIVLSTTTGHIYPSLRSQLPLANGKAVVSSWSESDWIEDFYSQNLVFAQEDDVESILADLVGDDKKRKEYAERCSAEFRKNRIEDRLVEILDV